MYGEFSPQLEEHLAFKAFVFLECLKLRFSGEGFYMIFPFAALRRFLNDCHYPVIIVLIRLVIGNNKLQRRGFQFFRNACGIPPISPFKNQVILPQLHFFSHDHIDDGIIVIIGCENDIFCGNGIRKPPVSLRFLLGICPERIPAGIP